MISAAIPAHSSHPHRKRSAVRRWPGWLMGLPLLPVGADAYIGPLLRITCGASVGRGDHTPPPRPVGGGLRPAPPGKAPLHANSRCFLNASPHCVGADSCVRPRTPPRRTLSGQTHRSASAGPIGNIHRTKNGRGQSPAPTAPLRKGSCRGSAATGGVPALPGTTHAAPVGADAYIGPVPHPRRARRPRRAAAQLPRTGHGRGW